LRKTHCGRATTKGLKRGNTRTRVRKDTGARKTRVRKDEKTPLGKATGEDKIVADVYKFIPALHDLLLVFAHENGLTRGS